MNWRPSRAALIDFWVFDYQEFYFSDGKILLRGENGSGKSVTMQSLFPVMLDGNISSKRLDPFGSYDRKMDYYVLYENKMDDRSERTSYILLEFEMPGQDRYITLGMGLNGRKGRNKLDVWYFIVNNNTRYRYDYDVVRHRTNLEGDTELVTLQKVELRKLLAEGVTHFDAKERDQYAAAVNQLLFGFPSMDVFQNWIELIVQLRTPKLANAKDMNVKAVYQILRKSMPALSDDELHVLIDSIQHIDHIHDDVETSTTVMESLNKISQAYERYNQAVLKEKASQYLDVHSREQESKKKFEKSNADLQAVMRDREQLARMIEELSNEETILQVEKAAYDDHAAMGLLERQEQLREDLRLKKQQEKDKAGQYDEELRKQQNVKQAHDETQNEHHSLTKSLNESKEEAEHLAEESGYWEHELYSQDSSADYKAWVQSVHAYRETVNNAFEKVKMLKEKESRLKEILEERARVQRDYDVVSDEIRKKNEVMIGLQEGYLQELSQWRGSLRALSIDDEHKKEMFTLASHIVEESGYNSIKSLVTSIARKQETKLTQSKSENKQALFTCETELIKVKNELTRWQRMTDPEPDRSLGTQAFRNSLRDRGVPHAPLYALIDWKESISPELRLDLESALYASGLLDALIAPSVAGENVLEDRVLQAKDITLYEGTLLEHVDILANKFDISEDYIAKCLSSIAISEDRGGQTLILSDKRYRIGALAGHAQTVEACYVGVSARERLRDEKIKSLQRVLEELSEKYDQLKSEQDRLHRELIQLAEDEKKLPVPTELFKLLREVSKLNSRLISLQELLDQSHRQHNRVYDECSRIRSELQSFKLNVDLTTIGCKNALDALEHYVTTIYDIQNKRMRIDNLNERLTTEEARIDEIEERIIDVRGEQNKIASDIAGLEGKLQAIEIQLNEAGADHIRERVKSIITRLNEIKHVLDDARTQFGELQANERINAQAVIDAQNELAVCVNNTQTAEKILNEELALPLHEAVETDLLTFAKLVKGRQGPSSDHAGNELDNVLLKERLLDYPFGTKLMFDNHGVLIAKRRVLEVATVTGKLNPAEAVREVSEKLEQLQEALSKEHQRLFEDIILNTLGQTIREKISKTNRWIDNLNRVMQKRNASISFRLFWKGKKAESAEELHTAELVDLLMARPGLLTEEDQEKIAQHFRVQIDRAREWASDESSGMTIQDALRVLLDYREWYDFKLECKRDKQWEEVNRQFLNTASGGQRALSVYVPLFSALHALYEGANEDAARLVTLDEAFAGVDERNITDMFDLIEEMDISYILTSQALWGDYPTVKSLSIAHLIKPQNANFASVAQFYWNGVERVPVMPLEEVDASFDEQLELSV